MFGLLAEYIINNYFKCEVTVYLDNNLCQTLRHLDAMDVQIKNTLTGFYGNCSITKSRNMFDCMIEDEKERLKNIGKGKHYNI